MIAMFLFSKLNFSIPAATYREIESFCELRIFRLSCWSLIHKECQTHLISMLPYETNVELRS